MRGRKLFEAMLPLTGLDELKVEAVDREEGRIRFVGLDEWFDVGFRKTYSLEVGMVLARKEKPGI